jgi:hypothetical protein
MNVNRSIQTSEDIPETRIPALDAQQNMRCRACKSITQHKLVFIHTASFTDEEEYDPQLSLDQPNYWEDRTYRIWVCMGCQDAHMEIAIQEYGPQPEQNSVFSTFYPPYEPGKKEVRSFKHLHKTLFEIYREAVLCYNTGAKRACAACLRAILEGILIEQGIIVDEKGKKDDLYHKIEKIRSMDIIPETTAMLLHSFRFMGNKALHFDLESIPPHEVELSYAIEAMEQLIYHIYEAQKDLQNKLRVLAKFRPDDMDKVKVPKP